MDAEKNKTQQIKKIYVVVKYTSESIDMVDE